MARAKGKVSAKSKAGAKSKASAKSKAGAKAKAGYLSKKYKRMMLRAEKAKKAAKNSKKKESSSFVPEPKDLGAMMRNQQEYNAQLAMNNMENNSVGEKQFAKMMRNHQNRVTKKKIGIFRRQTPTRAHGVKKGKKARGNNKSKKRSSKKNNNRK